MEPRFLSLLLATGAIANASGCMVHSVNETPQAPIALPESFSQNSPSDAEAATQTPDRWWTVFQDANLNNLVDQLLADNLDLRRGWTRLAQARAQIAGAESAYLPQIGYEAKVAGSRSSFNAGAPIGVVSNTAANYSIGLNVGWEADLWGKARSRANAAEFQYAATRQDIEGIALSLTGALTDTYLAAVGERELLALVDAQQKVLESYVELVELRFGQGLASALQVYQQQQQLATLQTQRPQIETRLRLSEHQLASLLGKAPGSVRVTERDILPPLPAAPTAGLPLDLLGRRPDVRAAQLRVASADYRVGAAIADRYPAFRINGSIGFQTFDLAEVFNNFIWNLAGSLAGPLFDGGRRAADIDAAQAAVDDALYAYSASVLGALKEVEDALLKERMLVEESVLLQQRLQLSQSSLGEAQARYINGLSDYLNVLNAIRGVQQTEQLMLLNKREIYSNRVQLYRALGGSWTAELRAPVREDSQNNDASSEESEESAQ